MKHTHPILCGILLASTMVARAEVPISPMEETAGAAVLAKQPLFPPPLILP